METTNSNNLECFDAARNVLENLITTLLSQQLLHTEHGKVEQLINKEGHELMRLLLQGHLDERARQETQYKAVKNGNCIHTQKRRLRPLPPAPEGNGGPAQGR